jgi:hypothetical protein
MADALLYFTAKIKYLTLRDAMRIWTPDVYFPTEREGRVRGIMIPNSYIRIFPDGQVFYSAR